MTENSVSTLDALAWGGVWFRDEPLCALLPLRR
jgi:hypothetical protein